MTQLQNDKLVSRREIVIPITLRGLWKGLEKIFIDAPNDAYKYVMRKIDTGAQHMMTGRLALVTMPLGLMLRNGSRVAHASTDNKGGFWSRTTAGLLALTGGGIGWYAAGKALFATAMTKVAIAGTVGKVGVMIGAAVLSAPAILPAATVGVLVGATALGLTATALSCVPAVANLLVAFNRTRDAWSGVKYSDKTLQDALAKDGLQRAYDDRRDAQTMKNFWSLSPENQRQVYTKLKKSFDEAAAPAEAPAAAKPAVQVPKAPKA